MLKYTSDRLFEREIQIMMESNTLIDNLNLTTPSHLKINEDNETTQDTQPF